MDSLQELLKDRTPAESPEIKLIKDFVQANYQETVDVMVRERDIVIMVSSAALANTLRLRSPEIKSICNTDKKLTFRIG